MMGRFLAWFLAPLLQVMSRFLFPLSSCLLTLVCGAVCADVIVQPVGVTVHPPLTQDQLGENLINQSGLSQSYSSLVDKFDSFIGEIPTHQDRKTGKWQTDVDFVLPGNIDFDLGGSLDISAIALWNTDDRNAVDAFTLLIDDNPEFSDPILLGEFAAEQVLTPQVFEFATTFGSHMRMTITSADGDRIRIGEVAFRVATKLIGDINDDGMVNFPDFLILSDSFSQTVETGANGDLNKDGVVDFSDFLILSANFGQTSAAPVPEPSGLLLIVLSICCVHAARANYRT